MDLSQDYVLIAMVNVDGMSLELAVVVVVRDGHQEEVPCDSCGGSGCKTCNYTGSSGIVWEECGSCGGSGEIEYWDECSVCKGSGYEKITCSHGYSNSHSKCIHDRTYQHDS